MQQRSQAARGNARCRVGFTLVELLVVIGIIALLVSILLPAMGKAREQGNTIKCLSNLRSIMIGAQIYSNQNKQYVLPAGLKSQGMWCNILADNGLLPIPTVPDAEAASRGPTTENNILFCPSGVRDLTPPDYTNNASVPADRKDAYGAMCNRHASALSKTSVDTWYGINGDETNTTTSGAPTRRVQTYGSTAFLKQNMIRRPTEMVMLFDGILYHHMNANANRVNARHGGNKVTNLAMFDGHAESVPTADLPGGMDAAVADFSLANLNAKHSHKPFKWRIDQR